LHNVPSKGDLQRQLRYLKSRLDKIKLNPWKCGKSKEDTLNEISETEEQLLNFDQRETTKVEYIKSTKN
jgi:hypothetical protein